MQYLSSHKFSIQYLCYIIHLFSRSTNLKYQIKVFHGLKLYLISQITNIYSQETKGAKV